MTKEFNNAGLNSHGFSYDQGLDIWFGTSQGYPLYISEPYEGEYLISLSAKKHGQLPDQAFLDALQGEVGQTLDLVSVEKGLLTVLVTLESKAEELSEQLSAILENLLAYLSQKGYQPACQDLDESSELSVYALGSEVAILSPQAFEKRLKTIREKEARPEAFVRGTVSALIGGLISLGLSLFVGYQGYIIWFTGFVLGFAVPKAYQLLAGKFSWKGLVISLLVLTAFGFLINELDYVLSMLRGQSLERIWRFYTEIRGKMGLDTGLYWGNFRAFALASLTSALLTSSLLLRNSRKRLSTRQLSF